MQSAVFHVKANGSSILDGTLWGDDGARVRHIHAALVLQVRQVPCLHGASDGIVRQGGMVAVIRRVVRDAERSHWRSSGE